MRRSQRVSWAGLSMRESVVLASSYILIPISSSCALQQSPLRWTGRYLAPLGAGMRRSVAIGTLSVSMGVACISVN